MRALCVSHGRRNEEDTHFTRVLGDGVVCIQSRILVGRSFLDGCGPAVGLGYRGGVRIGEQGEVFGHDFVD